MAKEIGICLTGHRPPKLDGYNLNTSFYKRLKERLEVIIEEALKRNDKVLCSSELALGADTVWSTAIFSVKKDTQKE